MPETLLKAAQDFIYGLDKGFVEIDLPQSKFLTALREAVEREELHNDARLAKQAMDRHFPQQVAA